MTINVIKMNLGILEGIPSLIEIPNIEQEDEDIEINLNLDLEQIEDE